MFPLSNRIETIDPTLGTEKKPPPESDPPVLLVPG